MSQPDFSLNRVFQHSEGNGPRLRIGILTNGDTVPAFAARVIEDIAGCDFADIVCVVRNAAPPPDDRKPPDPLLRRAWRVATRATARKHVLYRVYLNTLDQRGRIEPDPLEPIGFAQWIPHDAVWLDVVPQASGFVHYFPHDALAAIRAQHLDVLLRFGFNIIRGPILECAAHGVWSYHHGDSSRYRGGPPHFWELVEGAVESGVVLQRLTAELDAGQVLRRATFSTARTNSVSANRHGPFWSTTHFVIQALQALHVEGAAAVAAGTAAPEPYRGRRKIYRAPGNGDMIRWLAPRMTRTVSRRAARWAQGLIGGRRNLHWRVSLRVAPVPLYEQPDESALGAFRWLDSPRGHFWADPFLIRQGSDTWLFLEDFDYAAGRACIIVGAVQSDGTLRDVRAVLAPPYHLSYPHVFAHAGEIFMVPESSNANAIQLWRARRFPDDWVLEKNLLDLKAVDPTAWFDGERWWMFASPMPVDGHVAETYLWTATQLTGEWQLATTRAICSEVTCARPAGGIVRSDGRLLRPSQDCSGIYGGALWFNEVVNLPPGPYAERPLHRIGPGWLPNLVGVHTYARAGQWEAIDGYFRWPEKRFL